MSTKHTQSEQSSGVKFEIGHVLFNRKRVLLGRLEIKKLTANTAEEDRALVFNPSNVPTAIETADMLPSFYLKGFRLTAKEAQDTAPVARN